MDNENEKLPTLEDVKSENDIIDENKNNLTENGSSVIEEELDAQKILTSIKNRSLNDYFNSGSGLKDAQKVFGQTEDEIEKEFKNYKARKMFAKMDYLLIDGDLRAEEIKSECKVAEHYRFKSVTVLPTMLKYAKAALWGGKTPIRTLISYPYGEDVADVKIKACKLAVSQGADLLAVTVSTSAIKNGDYLSIVKEMTKISKIAKKRKVTAVIDSSKLNAVEVKNCAVNLLNECKIYSIMPSCSKSSEKPSVAVIKDLIKAVDGKCFIEGVGEVCTAEETVSVLSLGTSALTSSKCPLIVKDALKKLNAN